jgi:hypothetical protein
MNQDPEWLQGQTSSPSSVLRWHSEAERQFCVLPFYEGGIREPGRERYALWGRALSDGRFYPIPPSMYGLELDQSITDRGRYIWAVYVNGHLPRSVPMELATVSVTVTAAGRVHLEVGDVVTPEFVEERAQEAGYRPTLFYPDRDLWSDEPRDGQFPEEPTPLGNSHPDAYFVAPVETYLNAYQVLGIRPVTTALWNR